MYQKESNHTKTRRICLQHIADRGRQRIRNRGPTGTGNASANPFRDFSVDPVNMRAPEWRLAIRKKIVERHGGSITAGNALGRGSTFIVTLPIG